MEVYTARQAIFNRKKNVVAYELFFRDGEKNSFPDVDGDAATSKLLLDSHFNQGLHKLTSGKIALINFPEKAIRKQLPTLLPSDQIIVEILETVRPSPEVYESCRQLFHKGYKLALDDFEYTKDWDPFLKLTRMVKIDVMATPLHTIGPLISKLKSYKKLKLLAEKVETQEEFKHAKELGFDFFQGYFFCKPEVITQRDVKINHAVVFAMYQEILKKNFKFKKLAMYFEQDTSMTYKLLKFINSGLFPIRDQIGSIEQALIYLGEGQVKKFVSLILTAHLAKDKPAELTQLSIIRSRFCEQLAQKFKPELTDYAFLMGLFSLIDAILDQNMFDILDSLPLAEDISNALLGKEGDLFNILGVVKAYESASWSAMRRACARLRLDQDVLPEIYQTSIEWADRYKEIDCN